MGEGLEVEATGGKPGAGRGFERNVMMEPLDVLMSWMRSIGAEQLCARVFLASTGVAGRALLLVTLIVSVQFVCLLWLSILVKPLISVGGRLFAEWALMGRRFVSYVQDWRAHCGRMGRQTVVGVVLRSGIAALLGMGLAGTPMAGLHDQAVLEVGGNDTVQPKAPAATGIGGSAGQGVNPHRPGGFGGSGNESRACEMKRSMVLLTELGKECEEIKDGCATLSHRAGL